MLDIIVTHYDEPWETGKKFFDMLGCQRGIDFAGIRVILVHDGTRKFPSPLLKGYPYKTIQYEIPHRGVSAARNYGLDKATAKWVMFCDFDDTFSNVYALHGIMQHMDRDADFMWTPFLEEYRRDGQILLKEIGENITFIHGKFYRREWLNENGIRFPEGIDYSEDSAFGAVVNELAMKGRRGSIKAPYPAYIWCIREDSVSMKPENAERNMTGFLNRNFYVVEEFMRRNIPHERMVFRMFADAYWAFHRADMAFPEHEQYFIGEARKYLPDMGKVDDEVKEQIMAAARTAFIGQLKKNPESFDEWIHRIFYCE